MPHSNTVSSAYPLSPMQQGILFHSLGDSQAYVMQVVCRLDHVLDRAAFAQAWQAVAERHDIFRTGLACNDGNIFEHVEHEHVVLPYKAFDWRNRSAEDQSKALSAYLAQDRRRGFNLSVAPLTRVAMFEFGPESQAFVWTFHHAILDGRGRAIVLREVFRLYEAIVKGDSAPIAGAPSYRQFVSWYAQQNWSDAARHWCHVLKDCPTPFSLPVIQRADTRYVGKEYAECPVTIDAPKQAALEALALDNGLTMNTIVQAAWAILLSRYADTNDVLFGAIWSGRRRGYSCEAAADIVGLLINMLPIRVQLNSGLLVRDLLASLREQHIALRRFEHTPAALVSQCSGAKPGTALFDTAVVFEGADICESLQDGAPVWSQRSFERFGYTHFPLVLFGYGRPTLDLRVQYDRSVVDDATATRMAANLAALLGGLEDGFAGRTDELPFPSDSERRTIMGWSRPEHDSDSERGSIHHLFETQAANTPDATAIIVGDRRVSYRGLNATANCVAHYLRQIGVGAQELVGICVERSEAMVVAMLGTLKAGGAYLPLDPGYPAERVNFMLRDAGVRLLLTQTALADLFHGFDGTVIELDSHDVVTGRDKTEEPTPALECEGLAYVIYTSGSTGRPKGTTIAHRNVVPFLRWAHRVFDKAELAGVLGATSICFDLSIFEIFAPLTSGGAVILADNVLTLPSLPAASEVTLINTVPSAMTELLRCGGLPMSVLTVNLAGEPLTRHLVDDIYRRSGVQRVLNLYGPTETTTYSTYAVIGRGTTGMPPIGHPVDGTEVHVLDSQFRPVPIGAPGELYIAGSGVSPGYLGRPELTAQRFLYNPFSEEPSARFYRTGDMVRYRCDGELEFIGRRDHQVKIRGYRIELGEVETALVDHPAVEEAAVTTISDGTGTDRLVAYYVASNKGLEPSTGELRRFLKASVPDYMVPAFFVPLSAMPVTPNGKLDRARLPQPLAARPDWTEQYIAPTTPLEQELCRLWADVLKVDEVGIRDNFFELGGHSLLAMQLVVRAAAMGIVISPSDLSQHQTVAELAERVSERATALSTNTRPESDSVRQDWPLLPVQAWFFDHKFAYPHRWNLPLLVSTQRSVQLLPMERAVRAVVGHHEALRYQFRQCANEWRQYVYTENNSEVFGHYDLGALSAKEQQTEINRVATELSGGFTIGSGSLVRLVLFDLGVGRGARLLFMAHHLVCDFLSAQIVIEDVETAYRWYAQRSSSTAEHPPLRRTMSVGEWAERVNGDDSIAGALQKAAFWAPRVPIHSLPVDHPEAENRLQERLEHTTDRMRTYRLQHIARSRCQSGIDDLLLAAAAGAVARWSGATHLLTQLIRPGRSGDPTADLSRTVGWLVTHVPLLVRVTPDAAGVGLVRAVVDQVRGLPDDGSSYGVLRFVHNMRQPEKRVPLLPEPEFCFNYLGDYDVAFNRPRLFRICAERPGGGYYDGNHIPGKLAAFCAIRDQQIYTRWLFSRRLYDRATVAALARRFEHLLDTIIDCA
jgi:microcystin synthetase protein McyA